MSSRRMLVIGGAASGKSAWAEESAKSRGFPMLYIATARAWDDETRAKIAAHKIARADLWETRENPLDPGAELRGLPAERVVLLDCATMWLSNLMLEERDIEAATEALLADMAACPATIIVVTNEVGQGIVPDNALARRFREAQGRLNIRLAQSSDTVVQIVAGLPNVLKGTI